MLLPYLLLTANGCIAPTGLSASVCNFVNAPLTAWFPVVIAATFIVVAVLALFYLFSPLLGRSDIRTWVKAKMFDTLFSLILVAIFGAFAITVMTINPQSLYSGYNLVPQGNAIVTGCSGAQYFSSLAECDIYTFNSYMLYTLESMFIVTFRLSVVPQVAITFKTPLIPNLSASTTLPLSPTSPGEFVDDMLFVAYLLIILNQVQILLLAVSPLLFASFMAIGLIARIFGITRTFGGSMIAFAIGLGFIFPIMTALSYGFIDAGLSNSVYAFTTVFGVGGTSSIIGVFAQGSTGAAITLVSSLITLITSLGVGNPLLVYIGFNFLGLTFVPLLDFIITDAFIVDFSTAIGERIDFMSLVSSIL